MRPREYTVIIEEGKQGFVGHCPELPEAKGTGETFEECCEKMLDSIRVILSKMLDLPTEIELRIVRKVPQDPMSLFSPN